MEWMEMLFRLSTITKNPGAKLEHILHFEKKAQLTLPYDYSTLMATSNGVEGFLNDSRYLVLWPIEELEQLNKDYEVKEYLPNILLIGSDGGETGYGFDLNCEPYPIVQVPFLGMSPEEVKIIAPDMPSFLSYLRNLH